jgi:transposase-like protein
MAFSHAQIHAIELFAMGGKSCKEVAEEVGVAVNTISGWRSDYNFMSQVVDRSRQLLKKYLPDVYRALAKEAAKGSIHHIRCLLDHIEHIETVCENARKGNISFTWRLPDEKEEE